MRLFLLPISARRTLIFCDRSTASRNVAAIAHSKETKQRPHIQYYVDRAITKATATWSDWERADGGWKKTLTTYGNALLRRIPYEEWGLKSFPPLSDRLKNAYKAASKDDPVHVLFPSAFLPKLRVGHVLHKLATERQELHCKRMIGCAIGAPMTLPLALIPMYAHSFLVHLR
jgi:Mitochondrial K+-H+ exchange-related